MIAGTVVVLGAAAPGAAEGTKRGSLVAAGAVAIPPTFRYACTYAPPHVRLLLTYLRARYTLPVADGLIGGRFRRYSGDMAELGRGEILHWTGT
jgi:formylmethanofuran dehydrogenase subunit C